MYSGYVFAQELAKSSRYCPALGGFCKSGKCPFDLVCKTLDRFNVSFDTWDRSLRIYAKRYIAPVWAHKIHRGGVYGIDH